MLATIEPERAQDIVTNLPVTVYRTTPSGDILEGNSAVEHLLGYTVEEFTALHANDLYFEPGDRGPFMKERLDDGDIVRTVLRLKRKDGSPVWAEDLGRAVMDDDGKVLYFDGVLINVTERIQAEAALREREGLLSTIHDKAPIAIFNLGPDGKVFEANPQAHRMLGLNDGELIGKTIAEFTFADDAEESQEAFMRLKDGDAEEVALDKRYRRVDGKAIWGHVRAVAVRDADGEFSHTISLVQDITQRKRTEDAFRLLGDLTRQVNEAGDLEEAMQNVLDSICTSIGFSYGEAWLPDANGELQISPAWHGPDSMEMKKFRHLSEKITFQKGQGLAGLAMESDGPLWFENLSHVQTFVRAGAARGAGIECGLAVPVRSGGQFVAALVFLDGPREEPKDDTLRLVQFLADRLGSTVARRRLEIRLARQASIMEAQIEGASEGILVTSGEGEVLMVNRAFLQICGLDCENEDQDRRAMDLFQRERSNAEFMNVFHKLYEDRTDGQGLVELDRYHAFQRRSLELPDGEGGKVWYFTRVEPEEMSV